MAADRDTDIDALLRENVELRAENDLLRARAEETDRAREQAEHRAEELAALSRVAAALTNVTDLGASLQMAARELTEVFDTRGSTVTLIDEGRQDAEVVAEYFKDPSLPSVIGLKVPLDVPAWKQLDEKRVAIIIERPQVDSVLGVVRDVMRERSVSQLLVAPLLSRGVLIGNVSVSHEPGRSFAPNEVQLAQTLAGPVAQAVENARLYEAARKAEEAALTISRALERANEELERLSVTDALTGIPNRRLFHDAFDETWRRAQSDDRSIGVLMIDVDFFKAFNDAYGHQRGDECLTAVAAALQAGLERSGDFVARYGGEEFVVILPEADEEAARLQGERLCAQVRHLSILHEMSAAAPIVTVSVGCAAVRPAQSAAAASLLARADLALYAAKREGRNRVEVDGGSSGS